MSTSVLLAETCKTWDLETESLGLNFFSTDCLLCDIIQII